MNKLKKDTNTSGKKLTFCIDKTTEDILLDIYISRIRSNNKTTKNDIVCEAIRRLYNEKN
jgi:hypothetical protein